MFLESARIAFSLSSEGTVVEHNLNVAFQKVVKDLVAEKSFSSAERYADESGSSKLQNFVWRNKAQYFLNKKNIQLAMKYFEKANDEKGIEHCYQLKFQELQKKISSLKTVPELRKKKSVLLKMLTYAQKGKNQEMERYVKGLLKQV
ncbi:hypothetical protein HC823_01190 [Candidatus Gracilibacteria bacterium]|nr:hypothetical protein [Candidatus Gracilibacteria bacterium]